MRPRQQLPAVIAVAVEPLLRREDSECHVAVLAAIRATTRVACWAVAVGEADVTYVAETAATSFSIRRLARIRENLI